MILPILLLTGCDGDSTADAPAPSPADATPEVPSPSDTPATTPAAPPSAEPAAPAAPTDAPFVQPINFEKRTDAFTFWGWSADSRYFAFETAYVGSGGASCDHSAILHIIDADTDTYAVPPIKTAYPDIEAEPCTGPSPEEAMAMLRPGSLEQWGISAANYIAPLVNTEQSEDWLVEPASGPFFRLTLAQTGTASPEDYQADAGFRLEMHEVGHAGMPKVIESGERTRSGDISYRLVWVFPAPDDAHVAIILKKKRLDFEGPSYGFMSNGTTRIPAMVVEDGE